MKIGLKSALVLALAGMIVASCGAGSTPKEQAGLDVNDILTAGVGTLAASIFLTQTAIAPPPTQTSIPILASPTDTAIALSSPIVPPTQGFFFSPVSATVSLSPSPTGTRYTPTPNPLGLASGCNNLLLIRDETVPAGTAFTPGESFTKTWKVQNNGTCNWALQFRLVFIGGDKMDGDPGGIAKVIEPTKWTQISVGLTAPKQPGTYSGSWRLGTQTGTPFGSTLTVAIVVAAPTNTPLPPTSTPLPTDTPVPTSTETSTATPTP